MLQQWISQHPVGDVYKLRQRLIDGQMVTDQATDRWYLGWGHELWPQVDILNINIVQCFTIALHVGRYIFILYMYDVSFKCWETIMMMFKLTLRCCVSQSIIKILFKWDWWFWHDFVPNLLDYMCAKNYQNRAWFDKVIAKIKWVFLTHSENQITDICHYEHVY